MIFKASLLGFTPKDDIFSQVFGFINSISAAYAMTESPLHDNRMHVVSPVNLAGQQSKETATIMQVGLATIDPASKTPSDIPIPVAGISRQTTAPQCQALGD